LNYKESIKKTISDLFYFYFNIVGQSNGIRILMYHAIETKLGNQFDNIFSVSKNSFKSQIETLYQDNAVDFISFNASSMEVDKTKLKISITFDDGFSDNLYYAAPMLVEKSIPFTVFVTSDNVKYNKNKYLNRKELYELSQLPNVTIGSHGMTHRSLNSIKDVELKNELVGSKIFLEDVIGKEVISISYPSGEYDNKVIQCAKDVGYIIGGTSKFDINNKIKDLMALSRSVILRNDDEKIFLQKIYGAWDWYRIWDTYRKITNIGSSIYN